MKVNVKRIPPAGLKFEREVALEELGWHPEGFKVLSPLKIAVHLQKADEVLITDAKVTAEYEFICARCLEPLRRQRTDAMRIFFDITPKTEEVELSEELRQEMVMALSPIELCSADCRGICPACGINRNRETCSCAPVSESRGINVKLK